MSAPGQPRPSIVGHEARDVTPGYTPANSPGSGLAVSKERLPCATALKPAAVIVRKLPSPRICILSIGSIVATVSIAAAANVVIDTDASWLAKSSVPGVGWDTDFAFDTGADGGWRAAQNNASPPCGSDGCMIWWDGQFSTTQQVWLRKTFTLDGPVAFAFMQGGVDDDATILVNGTVVYDVFDQLAGPFGPIDIAPYLVAGNNLIAVYAVDQNQNHQFTARLTIDTATANTIFISTDASWLAKSSVPGVGWNTTFAFDTGADGGWRAAQVNDSPPCGDNGCKIWWDGQFSATE
jgi:hypothetical protein